MATGGITVPEADVDETRRHRVLTEKGLSFSKQQLHTNLVKMWKALEHSMAHHDHLIKVSCDVSTVERERLQFDKLLAEFTDVTTAYKRLLTDEELSAAEAEFDRMDRVIADFKTKMYSWLRAQKFDSQSVTSVKTRASSTKSSKRSSVASDSRIQNLAKLAALQTSKKFAEKEAQLERSRFESEQKTKELKLEKEMAITRAELAVYEEFDVDELGRPDVTLSSSSMPSGQQSSLTLQSQLLLPPVSTVVQRPELISCSTSTTSCQQSLLTCNPQVLPQPAFSGAFNPYVPPPAFGFVPRPPIMSVVQDSQQSVTSDCKLQPSLSSRHSVPNGTTKGPGEVVASFSEALKWSQLPKLELSVFAGDPLEFQQWLVSFENIVEDATTDPARRLHYLMQYTTGSAKVLVTSHALNQNEAGYNAAKAELVKEFGDPYILARAYLKRLEVWKTIPANDPSSLKAFSAFLKNCRGSMASLKHLQQLNTDLYLQKIVGKLSVPLQISWRNVVDQLEQSSKEVNFSELVDFVERQARIAKHPVFSLTALQEAENRGKHGCVDLNVQSNNGRSSLARKQKGRVVLTTTAAESDNTANAQCTSATAATSVPVKQESRPCPKCMKSHDLDDCEAYLSLAVEDRRKFLMANRMCFGCYRRNHDVRACRRRRRCQICGKPHPTGLHGFRSAQQSRQVSGQTSSDETQPKVIQSCATEAANESVAMNIVMVQLTSKNDPSVNLTVYAALDSMSTACFISRDVWTKIGCPGEPTEITIKTVTGESRQDTRVVTGLCVSSVFSGKPIDLPKVYRQDILPINVDEIPSHSMLMKHSHLSHLVSEIPDRNDSIPVGLIIGVNCPRALQPQFVIPSVDEGPFAVKTALGWCLSGPVPQNSRLDSISCNRIQASEDRVRVYDSGLKDMMLQMYETDFSESLTSIPHCVNQSAACASVLQDSRAVSQEDKKFLSLMESEVKLVDGHYQLPLPFRHPDAVMQNNRSQALSRARGLKRRFMVDQKFREDYVSFMNSIISKGYARKVSTKDSDDEASENKSWYIPHHGVYHPHKPGKIRVVFDCSCQYLGSSLNRALLQGPDLTNSLVGVLIRFRQEMIAVMADIEAMFHQVRVPESQLDYLRFVWWPDGDVSASLQDYQMTVHLFGAISSPSCANFALRKTAFDNEANLGTIAADTLRRNFYVDDMLKSVADVSMAVTLVSAVQQMCANGGFHLTKFVSNSPEVLETIPVLDRAKNVVNVNLSQSVLPVERALGVHWCIENDTLGFRIVLKDKPLTRRGMLSTISSIYDPLGLVAPFLLKGKKLLQCLCSSQLDWDQQIEGEQRAAWEQWRTGLPSLEMIEIPRCFKPPAFSHVSAELHHFSDASQIGYGQCSYLRFVSASGQVHCSLVIGKSRVAPAKPVTIPRLELTAATVSVKVGHMLEMEMQLQNLESIYWTDSKAVLGYIRNEARRFHTFVANRVQLIRDNSAAAAWNYIESEMNPADDASRGLDCNDISSSHRWFTGPSFLWKAHDQDRKSVV